MDASKEKQTKKPGKNKRGRPKKQDKCLLNTNVQQGTSCSTANYDDIDAILISLEKKFVAEKKAKKQHQFDVIVKIEDVDEGYLQNEKGRGKPTVHNTVKETPVNKPTRHNPVKIKVEEVEEAAAADLGNVNQTNVSKSKSKSKSKTKSKQVKLLQKQKKDTENNERSLKLMVSARPRTRSASSGGDNDKGDVLEDSRHSPVKADGKCPASSAKHKDKHNNKTASVKPDGKCLTSSAKHKDKYNNESSSTKPQDKCLTSSSEAKHKYYDKARSVEPDGSCSTNTVKSKDKSNSETNSAKVNDKHNNETNPLITRNKHLTSSAKSKDKCSTTSGKPKKKTNNEYSKESSGSSSGKSPDKCFNELKKQKITTSSSKSTKVDAASLGSSSADETIESGVAKIIYLHSAPDHKSLSKKRKRGGKKQKTKSKEDGSTENECNRYVDETICNDKPDSAIVCPPSTSQEGFHVLDIATEEAMELNQPDPVSAIVSTPSTLEDDFNVLDIATENRDALLQCEEEAMELIHPDNVRFIPVEHNDYHGILVLERDQMVAIKGCMQLAVVGGEVDVTGFRMASGKLSYVDVFSSSNASLYYIKNVTPHYTFSVQVKETLEAQLSRVFDTSKEEMLEIVGDIPEDYACVVVRKLHTMLPALLKKLNDVTLFPMQPKFLPHPFHTGVLQTDQWTDMFTSIQAEMDEKPDCSCSIMLCGAANVGKSSLARYIVNRMLQRHDAVFYLDCDCGQTEFTPPSLLSLVKVTQPLLGPPFSHQRKPVKSYFFGHISPGQTPAEYVKLIGLLFETYHTEYYSQGPLVINTQGWMQGLGMSLLVDCIRIISPCHVVHINPPSEKPNAPSDLTEERVQSEAGWSVDASHSSVKIGHGCKYHILSTTEVQESFNKGKSKSRVSRNQCITSYFSGLYEPYFQHFVSSGGNHCDWLPPSMATIVPYIVHWQDVALHIMHEKVSPDVMLFGFNLALVGLARVKPELIKAREEGSDHHNYLLEHPVAEYIGFGIVRNINEEKKVFYILTPEPVEKLLHVNALLRGSALLPTTYFLEET